MLTTQADRVHRNNARVVVGGAVILVVALGVAFLVACHLMKQTPFMAVPDRVSACGRDYGHPAGSAGPVPVGLGKVTSTWTWQGRRDVYGTRITLGGATTCGTGVYLRTSTHGFVGYALLGGP